MLPSLNRTLKPEGEPVKILDHGSVQLIEHWGSDERIVESARVSTQAGFVSWDPYEGHPKGDAALLSYLWKNKHSTPFEFAGITIEIQAPIVVYREWHRHRTQSYAEMSARYMPLPDFNYIPTAERCMIVNGANRQANAADSAEELTHEHAMAWLEMLAAYYEQGEQLYQQGLRWGIPKEVARLPIAVGRYSRMRATGNLRNWLAFLTLRSEHVASGKAAQWEIRQFANQVGELIRALYPRTFALFVGS